MFIAALGVSDMKEPLETPRPTGVLTKLQSVYELPGKGDEDREQGIIVGEEDGIRYIDIGNAYHLRLIHTI